MLQNVLFHHVYLRVNVDERSVQVDGDGLDVLNTIREEAPFQKCGPSVWTLRLIRWVIHVYYDTLRY